MSGVSRDPVSLRIGTQLPTDHRVSTGGGTEEVRNPPSPERVRKEVGGRRITLKSVAKFFGYAAAASIGAGVVFAALLHPATWACLGAAALFACIAYKGSSSESDASSSHRPADLSHQEALSTGHNANIADGLGSSSKVDGEEELAAQREADRKAELKTRIRRREKDASRIEDGTVNPLSVSVAASTVGGGEGVTEDAKERVTVQVHDTHPEQVGGDELDPTAVVLTETFSPDVLNHAVVKGLQGDVAPVLSALADIFRACSTADGKTPVFPEEGVVEGHKSSIIEKKEAAIESAKEQITDNPELLTSVISKIESDATVFLSQVSKTEANIEKAKGEGA